MATQTKQSAIGIQVDVNADGVDFIGGVTARLLKWLGSDITLTGSGSNTYTFPSATCTLAALTIANIFTAAQTWAAGTTTLAPTTYQTGTNLTTPVVGAGEFDGVQRYFTIDTSSGRGAIAVEQYVHLTANGSAITTIANFFGATTNISLVASAYYIIDCYLWYVTTGTGAVTFTFTNSAAPTSQNITWESTPTTGVVAPPGSANVYLNGQTLNDTTATKTVVTGSLSAATHYSHIKIWLKNGTGTSLKIQATAGGTNVTPQIGSWWVARRMSPNNIGTLAA